MTANGKKPKAEPAPPTTLFLFGAHGDLVKRLLMPALYNLSRDGLLGNGLRIVGVDHNAISDADFAKKLEDFIRTEAASKVKGNADNALDPQLWAQLAKGISYVEGDFLDDSTYADIAEKIADSGTGNAVFYLATAPRFFSDVVQRLGSAGLLTESDDHFRRVVIEKPFGSDLATAEALNACLLKVMSEKQIYRIDHYLGKETVQNILISRFSNVLFEAFWNNHYIDHVQITAAETVGVETRGNFFENTAPCVTWCPITCSSCWQWSPWTPAAFGADAVRGEKAKVIGAVRPWSAEDARANSVRGQYSAGEIGGKPVPGYRDEANVAPDSSTETFVALKVMIDNWRWVGVPFYLRTGKRMSIRDTEIVICFKPAPYAQFRDTEVNELRPTFLKIQIQPNEGMWFDLLAKRPGPTLDMANIELGFAYEDFFEMQPSTGYETLIYDCMTGDQTLFQRADNIENGWRAVQPFLDAWKEDDGIQAYKAGEDGPAAADALLARDGRAWHSLG